MQGLDRPFAWGFPSCKIIVLSFLLAAAAAAAVILFLDAHHYRGGPVAAKNQHLGFRV